MDYEAEHLLSWITQRTPSVFMVKVKYFATRVIIKTGQYSNIHLVGKHFI